MYNESESYMEIQTNKKKYLLMGLYKYTVNFLLVIISLPLISDYINKMITNETYKVPKTIILVLAMIVLNIFIKLLTINRIYRRTTFVEGMQDYTNFGTMWMSTGTTVLFYKVLYLAIMTIPIIIGYYVKANMSIMGYVYLITVTLAIIGYYILSNLMSFALYNTVMYSMGAKQAIGTSIHDVIKHYKTYTKSTIRTLPYTILNVITLGLFGIWYFPKKTAIKLELRKVINNEDISCGRNKSDKTSENIKGSTVESDR